MTLKNASVLLTFLAGAGMASAANVTFSGASASYDQGGGYVVAGAINGNAQDNAGWGIDGGAAAASQVGYFTASAPFSGTGVQLSIAQFLGGDHYAREFRVSYTTDAVPSAGGSWAAFPASLVRAANGLGLTALADSHYGTTGGANGGTTNYVLRSNGTFTNVTGFRLELFNPGGMIGAAANGNLVISEFMATTGSTINLALGAPVTSSGATYPGQFASFLTDGNTANQGHPADPPAQNGFSFTVDLQGVYSLTSLELANRIGGCCPERLSNFRVEVLSSLMTTLWTGDFHTDGSNSGANGIDTITAANGAGTFAGQYVRITNLSGGAYNPQIAEFRAFGTAVPEPGAAGMGVLVAAGMMMGRRRRR